jgi:hypothetical protein
MGCTIASIISFSTLRLAEVHRAKAVKLENNVWELHTIIIKGKEHKAVITFRPLHDVNVSPTTWLRLWFKHKDDEEQLHPLWWVRSLGREATREELSKAVHNVMI